MTKGDRTRKLLLDSAANLIAREGLKKVTARSLAEEAGVSAGLVIHYIPNLEDLFYLVVKHIFDSAENAKSTQFEFERYLRDLVERNYKYFQSNPSYYKCISLSYFYSSFDKRIRRIHQGNFIELRDDISKRMKADLKRRHLQMKNEKVEMTAAAIIEQIEGGLLFAMVSHGDLTAFRKRTLHAVQQLIPS